MKSIGFANTDQMVATEQVLLPVFGNTAWIEALSSWANKGCGSISETTCPLGLSSDSWQSLQTHLLATGWFVVGNGSVVPNANGQEFIRRTSELHHAIQRDTRYIDVKRVLSRIPVGACVDIGCGAGYSLLRLAKMGFGPLAGYDLSPVALTVARAFLESKGATAKLYANDATTLSEIQDTSMALIYSWNSLQYFYSVELAQSVRRVLRPGGYLLAQFISTSYYIKSLSVLIRERRWSRVFSYLRTLVRSAIWILFAAQLHLGARTPEVGWTRTTIRRFARAAGLEVESVFSSPVAPGYVVVMRRPLNAVE
jgi:SAM-dependent methyltransferase